MNIGVVIGILIVAAIVFFAFRSLRKKSGIVADTTDKPKPKTSDEINDEIRERSGN